MTVDTSTYSGSTPVLNADGESASRALLQEELIRKKFSVPFIFKKLGGALLCECEYFVNLCFQLYLVEISLPQPLQLPSCLLAWAVAGSG